jgi:hypothetical protein
MGVARKPALYGLAMLRDKSALSNHITRPSFFFFGECGYFFTAHISSRLFKHCEMLNGLFCKSFF